MQNKFAHYQKINKITPVLLGKFRAKPLAIRNLKLCIAFH